MKLLKNAKWEKWPLSILKVICISLLQLFIILKVTVSHDRSYTLCHVIRCPKWPLLEDDLTIHAWNRWPLAVFERWPLKRVKLYSNISWTGYIILNTCKSVRRHGFVIVYLRQKTSSDQNLEENIILFGPGQYTV
jgi:hypothetical protein